MVLRKISFSLRSMRLYNIMRIKIIVDKHHTRDCSN